MNWPRAALLSLSDKRGAVELARALVARGTRILASGGTARHLEAAGVPVTPVERWTGFEELIGGRVKTLHPHVHAPILARRSVEGDMQALAERELEPIDLVAVTLYPFESKAPALDEAGAVEEIDIGGVALLRAAAKSYTDVIVAHDPRHYPEVVRELEAGGPTLERRRAWATATFAHTAAYDAAIAGELERRSGETLPSHAVMALARVRALRYGENPHQRAALYARGGDAERLETWREGKELSFNNLLDLEAAVALVARFAAPACVIVKHTQPCGVACGENVADAYAAAFHGDELSAFGGIVAFNRPIDREAAARVAAQFVECVAAPGFEPGVEDAFASKKNLRLLRLAPEEVAPPGQLEIRFAGRWVLLQSSDGSPPPVWKTMTRREPTAAEVQALEFAWEVAAAARSNAVAITRGTASIGIGSGQTSRVDAVDLALTKARRSGHDTRGAVLASDGFFPFADNIEHAAAAGIAAIVQPGGSMRDAEVIEACDRHGVAMLFTGRRTFRH